MYGLCPKITSKDITPCFLVCVCFCVLVCSEDPTKVSKENQWMGVTVNSQGPGGKIVVSVCVCVCIISRPYHLKCV